MDYYPGSNQQVAPVAGLRDVLADYEGAVFKIKGKEVELFTISQLASVLNRKPGTIRRWELEKVIPKATYVKPGADQDPRGRRRLYSREQVLAVHQAAGEEGILTDMHKQVSKTEFSHKVWAAFRRLAS